MDNVIVSDLDQVEQDNFYLTDSDWETEFSEEVAECRKMAEAKNLYYGYLVEAKTYLLFGTMDSQEVFIDFDGKVIMYCGGEVINSGHEKVFEA